MIYQGWRNSFPPMGVDFTVNRNSMQAQGLVAWWPSLDSSGMTVMRGRVGAEGNGILSASNPTWATDSQRGQVLSFSGAAGTVTLSATNVNALFNPLAFSIFMEIRLLGSTWEGNYFILEVDGDNFITLSSLGGLPRFRFKAGGTFDAYAYTPPAGAWHWAGMVLDKSNNAVYCYWNGNLVRTLGYSGTWAGNFTLTYLGSTSVNAAISELRLHKTLVPVSVIKQMYYPATRWELYTPAQRYWPVYVAQTMSMKAFMLYQRTRRT